MKMNEEVAVKVLSMLMSSSFERWYVNDFMDFVEGEENAPTETQILAWLSEQLG
jgi:hypothetical protein